MVNNNKINQDSMEVIKKINLKNVCKKVIPVCLLFFMNIAQGHSQNFSYSFAKDSVAYAALNSPTLLSTNESWSNKQFKLALPFSFNCAGTAADTVFIETNGFLVFNKAKQLAIVAFNDFSSRKDTNQNYTASLGYTIEGSAGNRIVKFEFRNLSRNMLSTFDHMDYQVWLYENGNKIEFHIGSNPFAVNAESPNSLLLGIINRNMNSDPSAYLIQGNPSLPTAAAVNSANELIYLDNIPFEGVVLRLTPTY
jgi:hypothetical protein